MKWINVGHIRAWTNQQRECQQLFPELIRRLIRATASNIEEIDFPSGDSINTPGWDGKLRVPVGNSFFPSGTSVWEIGVGGSPKSKAEDDYSKRTADPLGTDKKDTTFVFATPKTFTDRSSWAGGKAASGEWKDVRVINLDMIDQWLETAPAVSLWLARKLGIVNSTQIRAIETVWEEWSLGTESAITPKLVISGRDREKEDVQVWVSNKPSIKEVQGDHPEEAMAFLYASMISLPEAQKEAALSRCIVVENCNDFRQVNEAYQNLIIVAPAECLRIAPASVARGNHVYICMDSTVIGVRPLLRLPRPRRMDVEQILHESGMSESDSQRYARDSGRSIPVLRRQLFPASSINAPSWANADSAPTLLSALFANAWDESKEDDRRVIEMISGKKYDDFVKELNKFLPVDDSPVRKVGSVWMIKSPLDSWYLLNTHLGRDHLDRFKKSLLYVLTKADPKYDLEPEKRWSASIYGKSNPYSEWLQTGLVESLVLITVFDNPSVQAVSIQAFADNVVKKIISSAEKWELWASISGSTPLLAEASPIAFMEELETKISQNKEIFIELMSDDSSGIFGECKHSGLLWSLESLAWSREYFTRAVNIIFDLAKIDTGGRWANRPMNSLKDIFIPARPQTHSAPKDRLATLDGLIQKDPKLVWEFAKEYYNSGSISESHRLRWRETGGHRRGLEPESNEDFHEYIDGLLTKVEDLACIKENVISAVGDFIRLPLELRKRLIKVLLDFSPDTYIKEENTILLNNLRDALNWINNYGKDEYREHIDDLNKILDMHQPENIIDRVGWLLSTPWPELPQSEPRNYDKRDEYIRTAQKEAARELLDKAELKDIMDFARTVQPSWILGLSIGKAIKDDAEDLKVLSAIIESSKDLYLLIAGYSEGRISEVGKDWVVKMIEEIKTKGIYSEEVGAYLFLGLPEGDDTWSIVNKSGEELEKKYWEKASGYSKEDNSEDAPIAIEKLLDVKRPKAALKLTHDPKAILPSSLLKRLLEDLLNLENDKFTVDTMDEFYLGHVFDRLYKNNDLSLSDLARLEWPFASLFDKFYRHTSTPTATHRLLQDDPSFFSELCIFIYRREDRKPDTFHKGISKKKAEVLAHIAHKVLDSWNLLPGLKDAGEINEKELLEWINSARENCAKEKRITGCDIQIGFLLAKAPTDADGLWPHMAVRNVIECLNNKVIDEHIENQIFNSRGVVSRGINEGGEKERVLSEKYKKESDALKTKWPRTSAILRKLSATYDYDARREDLDTDLHDLRWD